MKPLIISTTIQVYEHVELLGKDDQELLKRARQALEDTYAPYSKFKVGAALLLESGEIVPGSNQENASYPLCLCAERVAIAAADAHFPKIPIAAIAVTARNPRHALAQPVTPCGACRQVLVETEQKHRTPMRVILQGEVGSIYVLSSAKDLLPLSFDASFLKGD